MEHFEEGLLDPESLIILKQSISEGMDKTGDMLYDWNYISGLKNNGFLYRMGLGGQKYMCWKNLLNKLVFKQVALIYDVFQNYIVCSNKALDLLEQMKEVD